MGSGRSASIPEFRAMSVARDRYDVAILGGGLAGLTLALQLKRTRPETGIVVTEKREGPAPEAAFKVGESTIPSGAHYYAEVVGMKDHLESEHYVKCGLRFFLPAGDNTDITRRLELGPPTFPPHPNYQIDRGRFENELAARCRKSGTDLLQGCRVSEVELGGDYHTVTVSQAGEDRTVATRWVVDASGRASLLKRKLGLAREVGHTINSAWFRLRGGLDLEEWGSDNERWMARMFDPGIRKFSTNHLLGEGYWVWLILLASDRISIGICADPRFHPYEEINELDRALDWIGRHEPQLASALEGREGDIEDFLRIEDYAFGCERVYSPDRWCLTGEAAAFADPFYSPGSDFIGYGNLFITDLITRELSGEDIGGRLEYFNSLYFRTFDKTLSIYEDQYQLFGNSQPMALKIVWDTVLNHWAPTLLMVKGKLCDLEFMSEVDGDLDRVYRLNARMQEFFRELHALGDQPIDASAVTGPPAYKALIESFGGLVTEYDDAGLRELIARNADVAEATAVGFFYHVASQLSSDLNEDTKINPFAISLQPDRWEADGLFEPPGLTVAEARELAEGVDTLWAAEVPAAAS